MSERLLSLLRRRLIVILLPLVFLSAYLVCNTRHYFFDDELFTVGIAKAPWGSLWTEARLSEVHPPLSPAIFKAWMRVFGEKVESTQAFSLLLVGAGLVLYGMVFTELFPLIGWRFLFFAAHPLLVLWGGAARYYPPLFFLFYVSVWIAVGLYRKGLRPVGVAAFCAVSILGLYTEVVYLVAFIPQLLLLWLGIKRRAPKGDSRKKEYILLGCIVACIFLLYLPWLQEIARQLGNNRERFGRSSVVVTAAYLLYGCLFGQSIMPFFYLVTVPAAVLFLSVGIYGLRTMYTHHRDPLLVWAVLTCGAFFTALPVKLITCRHWLFLPGLLLIPVFYGLSAIPRPWLRRVATVLIASVFLYGNYNIAVKKQLHKSGLMDPMGRIIAQAKAEVSGHPDTLEIYYSNLVRYYLLQDPVLRSDQLLFVQTTTKNVPQVVASSLQNARFKKVVYLWCYFGEQPEVKMLDMQVRAALQKYGYVKVSEKGYVRHEVPPEVRNFISGSFENPRGFRYIFEEYQCIPSREDPS